MAEGAGMILAGAGMIHGAEMTRKPGGACRWC